MLTAALLHAVWNAIVKSRGTPEFSIAAFQLVGALVCLCLAPLLPAPDRESWPMILASVIIHNFYYFTLARAYRTGDLSQVYPLFRGLAPVLVDNIFDTILQLHAEGTTILLVEQNARMALQVASRGYVIQTGVVVLSDTAENLQKNEMIRKVYMGEN